MTIMIKYAEFAPTGFDHKGAFLPEQQDWLVAPVSQNRDSGPLAESNFASFLAEVGGESESVEVHRFGHWGPGWFEIILIAPNSPHLKRAEELEAALEDYPVLDDQDYSKREHEEYCESWDYWGRLDYVREIKSRLFKLYSDGVSEDCTDDEIEDAISELTTEEIDSLRDGAAAKTSWVYQSENSGVSINIKGLADNTDLDKLADLAIDCVLATRKANDIKKLAAACGATQEQQRIAVSKNLMLVSEIRKLMELKLA